MDSGLVEIDGGEVEPFEPWRPEDGVREVRHYSVRRAGKGAESGGRDVLSGSLLWAAGVIIAASLVGAGYVAYESQRLFALAHVAGSDKETRAAIIAALPDAGWGAMALVALVAALRGRSSVRARFGIVVFFGLSLGAQLMFAQRTVEGILVAVIAPVTLAWMLESFVVEVRRWAGERRGLKLDEAPIMASVLRALVAVPVLAWRLMLWAVRLGFDRRGTWGGVRDWVLDEAPLAPGRTATSLRAAAAVEQAGQVEQAAIEARSLAATEIERVHAEHAEQIERIRQETAEQITAATRATDEALQQCRATGEQRIRELRESYEQQAADRELQAQQTVRLREEQLQQARQNSAQLASELERIRQEYDRVLGGASAKSKLIAAYEQLGRTGDPRYGDRDRVGEVARELYEAAGLRSDGTARAYLGEYLQQQRVTV